MKISVGQLVGIVILLILIAAAGFFGMQVVNGRGNNRQAVFLTNGQVYFGKVTRDGGKTIVMKDIYYLQVQQPLQPAKENEQPQISLVKLGNELHGPEDEMRINREHVLFVEDMKDDSKVNQAIANFIKNGGQIQTTPAPQ
jgi:hypothetical protein